MASLDITAGLDPQTQQLLRMFAQAPRPQPTLGADSQIAMQRLANAQKQAAARQQGLQGSSEQYRAMGVAAPLVGGLRAWASTVAQNRDNARQEDLLQQVYAARQAEREQAAAAQAEADRIAFEREKELQASDPRTALAMATFKETQERNRLDRERQRVIDEENRVKAAADDQRKQEAAQIKRDEIDEQARRQENLTNDIRADIGYLLAPEQRGALESATGSIQGMLPSVRQGVVDWENRWEGLKNRLTTENLKLMSGVLSESDIKLLSDVATGGVNLRSSDDQVIKQLDSIQGKIGQSPQGVEDFYGRKVMPEGYDPNQQVVDFNDLRRGDER